MSHHRAHTPLQPPDRIQLPAWPRLLAVVAAVLGAWTLFRSFTTGHPETAWSAYLIGAFYVLGLGVFGALWIAILYLCRGVWSVTMRRIPEAMTAWLLPGGVLALLVALGGHSLYHWTDAEAVAGDALLTHKAPFLNLTMFLGLVGVSLASWVVLAFLLVRNSRRQDEEGGVRLSQANASLSALFVIVFALTISLVGFYLLMSLDPHWFSTMFAVLVFTDLMQTGTAFVALVAGCLILRGGLNGFVNENHLHSLGKMVFATTGFWAYIAFCQFMLIWYANLPEETIYYIRRWENGWMAYLLILPVAKFAVPFIALVPRRCKRCARPLMAISAWILLAQFLELFVMVSPAVGHGEHGTRGHLPVIELAVTAGFLGLFYLVFERALRRHRPVPFKDPFLQECLEYHPA
ncbi:MAG: hypothetical protein ABIL09_01305 [Gemmatimonadota bacterium]